MSRVAASRRALQVIELNSADPLDAIIGFELSRARIGIERRAPDILWRAEAAILLDHPHDSEPRHAHGLEDHDRGRDDIGREEQIVQAELVRGSPKLA